MKTSSKATPAVAVNNNTEHMEVIQTPDVSAELVTAPSLKVWEKVHPETGEVVPKYKYLEGHPRQYRFDSKEGHFNINGVEKIGRTLTFQPLAWRIFTDNILNMGTKK